MEDEADGPGLPADVRRETGDRPGLRTVLTGRVQMSRALALTSPSAQVQMELVVLEANDVAEAIAQEVTRREVDKLVVGASSSGIFSRYSRQNAARGPIRVRSRASTFSLLPIVDRSFDGPR